MRANRLAMCLSLQLIASYSSAEEPPPAVLGLGTHLIGKLHAPMGQVMTIAGVAVDGPLKGSEGGPNLRVQQIQGTYYQSDIQIDLDPYSYDWNEQPLYFGDKLPALERGKSYELEGYETGGYVGIPWKARPQGKDLPFLQTTGHYFRHTFFVTKVKEIEPIRYTPRMFEGRKALMSGTAESKLGKSILVGPDWLVVVDREKEWPKDIEGTEVETYGFYNPDATWKEQSNLARKNLDFLDGTWWPTRLEDQVGKQVALRGMARSRNDVWWFNYRGTDIYVENMSDLPGWTGDNHWRPMVIEGRLERATLPRLDQTSLKPDRNVAEHYIVREPTWKPLRGGLLFPEIPVEDE